jgi:hypothetical protein
MLNPTIRMSWIRKHWDKDFIDLAEEKIKQTVSLLSQTCFGDILSYFPQDA